MTARPPKTIGTDWSPVIAILIVAVAGIAITALIAAALSPSKPAALGEGRCAKFLSVPERHLDRVPDACIPFYFAAKGEEPKK